jgi:hypothetical protein
MQTETIKLSEPIKDLEGKEKKFVDIRKKVLVGDWRAANKAGGNNIEERMIQMVMRLTGLAPAEVEQLCMADFYKLSNKIDLGTEDPKE